MLITAMVKIKAYNWLYQQKTFGENREMGYAVQKIQDEELKKIEISCAEHAIISLATSFEVYYKELLQELLYRYPKIFLNTKSEYQERIEDLITAKRYFDYEYIAEHLQLKNRHDFIKFFKEHNVPLLIDNEEKVIEHIYVMRNCYVHNAGRVDKKTGNRLNKYPSPTAEGCLTTEAKRLRTRFNKLILKVNERVLGECGTLVSSGKI